MAKKSRRRVSEPVEEPRKSAPAETRVRRAEADVESGNNSVIRNIIILVLILLGLYLLMNFVFDGDNQENGDKTNEDETSQVEESDTSDSGNDEATSEAEPSGTSVKETEQEFSFVVGEGESYTTMARRAVAAIDENLTTAERVAAETKLTTDANAQWLNEGQALVLGKSTVQSAIDWAKSLTDEEKSAWQPYADLVAW